MTAHTQSQLNTILKRIRLYHPQKVILFGSYAWGRPSKSSDVDLLVIKPSKKPRHHRIKEVEELIYPSPLPVDVIVYTPQELKRRFELGDFFVSRIVREGKILYEKK